jgi:FKBP-type peptidyl-prolyl cis-trans isomerase
MIQGKFFYLGLGIVAGGFCAVPAMSAAEAAKAATAPQTQTAAAPASPVGVATPPPAQPTVSEDDKEAFSAMGFMIAKQMRMDVDFSDQQLEWIFAGFKDGAKDAPVPADYREAIHRAEMIYRSHMGKIIEKQREDANANMKAGEDYVNSLPDKAKLTKTESGLYYEILAPGNPEKKPANIDHVKVNYVGSFIDGKVFDKSDAPVELPVGGVVPGFSEGLKLIGEGGKIRLYIPGDLGYGMQPPQGSSIKPGAMLIFEAEIVEVVKGKAPEIDAAPHAGLPHRVGPRSGMVPPPPPPTTPPPPLPPEVEAQLKNAPKDVPPAPPAEAKPEAAKPAAETK